ncbi:MAG TPA: Ser-Thr-rich GPI-anchored membrane family protein, partial [Candidatus Cloacimonadota bacterium]|nr:Ser-Thr-rich GPI-anchored membrane family protein [Candidatus Cloacimonadota bacterium]
LLSILSPNGGEAWYIGDTNDITWTASDTNLSPNSVYLWYSMNGGSSYTTLAEAIANSGSYPWEMPSTQSYNARVRIRVSDSFGNFSQKASASSFTITYVPPQAPTGVNVNTTNGIDAIITWQPVTQTISDTPITPDGYIVLYNESPYEDDQFYYFLAMTTGLSHTHPWVARFRNQMFYKVIAFKDYRGALANILQPAVQNPELKLTLAEIKEALQNYPWGGEK